MKPATSAIGKPRSDRLAIRTNDRPQLQGPKINGRTNPRRRDIFIKTQYPHYFSQRNNLRTLGYEGKQQTVLKCSFRQISRSLAVKSSKRGTGLAPIFACNGGAYSNSNQRELKPANISVMRAIGRRWIATT